MVKGLGVYVHIPFCRRKCAYCDFLSFACDKNGMDGYVSALIEEIKSSEYKGRQVDTVFIGGGTPSMLCAEKIGEILDAIKENFNVETDAEITIEGNPDSLTFEKMTKYREYGVNRLSIGFQSLNPDILKTLGRVHTRERALEVFREAREAGFSNVNVDLIFGVPGDDRAAFRKTLEEIVALGPEHISAYSLIVEEGTEIFEKIRSGKLPEPDDGVDRDDYHFAVKFLENNGYLRYEISNFAKKGKESRHNTRYWKQEEYVGFGIGAASFADGRRFANADDFNAYVKGIRKLREDETLSHEEMMDEFMMLGFRMSNGPDFAEFSQKYGCNAFEIYREKLEKLQKEGLLGADFRLTEKGFDFANKIFEEFV